MAAKPSKLPTWATDPSARITEPTSAKKGIGHTRGEKPPSTYENHWKNLVYQYAAYVADLALVGPMSLAGDATFNGDVAITGDLSITGAFVHGDRTKNISPLSFSDSGTDAWRAGSSGSYGNLGYIVTTATAPGECVVPIPLDEGDRIKSMVFACYGDGAADLTSVKVFRLSAAGVVTDITAAATSVTDAPASWADATVDVTDTVATAGDVFWIQFAANAQGLRVGSIRVTYDRPA